MKTTRGKATPPRLVVKQARRQTGGRRFEAQRELSLAGAAREAIEFLPGSAEGLLVRQEAAGPFGIPDFLCLTGDLDAWRRRRRLRVPPVLNPVDASIVARASHTRPYGPKTLAKFAGLTEATVERRLPHLLRSGALIGCWESTVVRPFPLQTLGRLFAVEMKVVDWQRALRQCRRYALWADAYFLVMERVPVDRLNELRRAVASDRGGLMVAGEVLLLPRTRRMPRARRMLASEYFYASTLAHHPSD